MVGHSLTSKAFSCFQVTNRLAEFRELVKEVVRSACRTALLEAGFVPDDHYPDADSQYGGMISLLNSCL